MAGRLVRILPEVTSEPLIFSLVYPSCKQVPRRIRALIDYLIGARMFDCKDVLA
jgi:DNA-binding transcriptional LysR family regulator